MIMANETKIINNTVIMESRKRIIDTVNAEINEVGIPVSVMSMILHSCVSEVDALVSQVIASENNLANPGGSNGKNG